MTSNDLTEPSDRRIQRTRETIISSFLSLMLEKGFANIIIKDITERANINRSTFYTHYEDKYDLQKKITASNLSALGGLARQEFTEYLPSFDLPDPYYVLLFEQISQNEAFYRAMLLAKDSSLFAAQMLEVVRESGYARIARISAEKKLVVPMDLLLDYMSFSLLGMIRKWLEQEMIYTPRHMALQLTRLSRVGIYEAMGFTNSPME